MIIVQEEEGEEEEEQESWEKKQVPLPRMNDENCNILLTTHCTICILCIYTVYPNKCILLYTIYILLLIVVKVQNRIRRMNLIHV